MENAAELRFQEVLRRAATDETFRRLQQSCDALDQSFLAVLQKLSPDDRQVIMTYLQTLGQSALRLTELACQ